MTLDYHLLKYERDQIIETLTATQKDFLQSFLKRGKKTVFANLLAREKASGSTETRDLAEEWELIDYHDAGPNWQATSDLFCECGRRLRYQYVVKNKLSQKIKYFGIDHFEMHTGIPGHLANKIRAGFETIDFELDELLIKLNQGWRLQDEGIEEVPEGLNLPQDIQRQLDLGLPLLANQVKRLRDLVNALEYQQVMDIFSRELDLAKQPVQEPAATEALDFQLELDKRSLLGKIKADCSLAEDVKGAVLLYMKKSETDQLSAREITANLVEEHGVDPERFSTGKYKFYPKVCLFLERLSNWGLLQLSYTIGKEDRIYQLNQKDLAELWEKL